jgi:hypothetical protein
VIINFYYIDKDMIPSKSPEGFINFLKEPENLKKFKIEEVCTYDQAQKFVARDHL